MKLRTLSNNKSSIKYLGLCYLVTFFFRWPLLVLSLKGTSDSLFKKKPSKQHSKLRIYLKLIVILLFIKLQSFQLRITLNITWTSNQHLISTKKATFLISFYLCLKLTYLF